MRKMLRFILVCFYHRFIVIEGCDKAEKRGLVFESNVHGDAINMWNCRSFWRDEYGFRYRCSELHK